MEQIIISIAAFIEQLVAENVAISPDSKIKNWGFVELVNRESKGKKGTTTQPIPVTINGTGDRQQVSLDDDYDFMHWIRWTVPDRRVANDADQWGLSTGNRKGSTIRIVIAHKVELGEELVDDIAQSLPENIDMTGFSFVFINERRVNPNHEEIYNVELGKTVYEQHRFDWNIYTIDVDIEFSKCVAFSIPSLSPVNCLTDENGECITP